MTFNPRLDLSFADYMAYSRRERELESEALFRATVAAIRAERQERLLAAGSAEAAARAERKRLRVAIRATKRKAKACATVPGIGLLASDPCAYCGEARPTTHDHVEPFSRGGAHELDNLVRACWRCNREKNTQPLLLFLARRALRRAA